MKAKYLYRTVIFLALTSFKVNAQVNEINFNYQNFNSSALPRTSLNPMSIKMWDNYGNGGPTTYSTILEIYGLSGHQTSQLSFGGWDNSKIKYREAFYAQNSWSNWISLLDSKNDVESSGLLKMAGNGNHYLSQGKFGIGTLNPISSFDVRGTLRLGSLGNWWIRDNSAGSQFAIGNGVDESDQNIDFIINNSGNVGIGTISPSARLSLNGVSENDLDAAGIRLNNNWSANGNFFISSYVNLNTSDNNLKIGENAEAFVTIISDSPQGGLTRGNVGIGTTIPDEKLTVNGKIHAKEVKVDLSFPAPDYVFNDDYKLTPLSEIQTYIKINKHLPEIPSAKEMEINGINLSEMNMLLLKKIEELTIYMIRQQETNLQQSKQIDYLTKMIKK